MATFRTFFEGKKLLKLILQLVRYDIPPLIVGKSSIGKSYTILELATRWRLPHSMLYIGSEKPENIEGLAKLIGGDNKADILKFLKPYWFPNEETISSQVANGRKILEKYAKVYSAQPKFTYSYGVLHQILIGLMDTKYEENTTEYKGSLIDTGESEISISVGKTILNEKPFTFKRSLETSLQAKTAHEDTLTSKQAGRDDMRDMCMYLCTILGYGNYWLVLDELDKVSIHEHEKYAPLLHIVRERTLKDWTLKQINDKKGLNIPLTVKNNSYQSIADSVNSQIDKQLPLLDCRVIGIANATKGIEEALFRRFCQVIMDDTMQLYMPDASTVAKIIKCIDEARDDDYDRDLKEDLMTKLVFLDDVNLQWQYSFLPKLLNHTDEANNFIYQNFNDYYNKVRREENNNPEQVDRKILSPEILNTGFGKIMYDNFLADKEKNSDLQKIFNCMVRRELMPNELEEKDSVSILEKVTDTKDPIQQLRLILEKSYQEDPNIFWDKTELDIIQKFKLIHDSGGLNIGKLKLWVSNTLDYTEASLINAKGEYDQLPGIGDKMLPVIYKLMITLISKEPQIDMDLFNSTQQDITNRYDKILSKGDASKLKFDESVTQKAFYGASKKEFKGMPRSKMINVSSKGLFQFYPQGKGGQVGEYCLSFNVYMKKYFGNEFTRFNREVLGDTREWVEFKDKAAEKDTTESKILNFLSLPKVFDKINDLQSAFVKSGQPETRQTRNLGDLIKVIDERS